MIHSDISVVMISMNEEAAVGQVIEEIQAHVPGCEILLVDSSTDRTPEVAKGLGAAVIRQYPPQGYGKAMDLALRSANRDIIVTLDCDGSYPAEKIPALADLIRKEGFDYVDACRIEGKPASMKMINYLANLFFAGIASVLFLRKITDLHSGMRAYKRSMIQQLRYDPKGAALPVELFLRPLRMGFRLKIYPIQYRDRIGRSTMKPLESALWTVKRIYRSRFK